MHDCSLPEVDVMKLPIQVTFRDIAQSGEFSTLIQQ